MPTRSAGDFFVKSFFFPGLLNDTFLGGGVGVEAGGQKKVGVVFGCKKVCHF